MKCSSRGYVGFWALSLLENPTPSTALLLMRSAFFVVVPASGGSVCGDMYYSQAPYSGLVPIMGLIKGDTGSLDYSLHI